MKLKVIIDPQQEEQLVAILHDRTELVNELEALIAKQATTGRICAYTEDEMMFLQADEIECITVLDGKTFAIDTQNRRYRIRQRLYELEENLPSCFIRINKSTLANEKRLERFVTTYSGAVDAVFRCGYREYVSRRCFSQIKRRLAKK